MDGLNNIALNDSMLVAFYGHSLISFNGTRVMVVTKTKLTSPQHELLMQILNACKLEPRQVAIVNTSNKTSLEDLLNETSPQFILSFGTGDGTELFTMGNNEGRKYLNAPSLEEMMYDTDASKQLKRKTWNELKLFFGIG
jgi:DNA polymerase III psi subunit